MYQDRRRIHSLYLLVDIFFIILSFYLPYVLRYNSGFTLKNLPWLREYTLVFILWAIFIIFIFNNYHLYATDRSLNIPTETWRVIRAVLFSSILGALVIYGFQIKIFSRLVFSFSVLLLIFILSLWRAIKRIWIRYLIIKGTLNMNVLIVGAGKSGQALAEEIQNNPYLGLKIIGFLDDSKTKEIEGINILGKIKDLEDVIRKNFVDEIYITIPSERKKVADIIFQAKRLSKTVRIVTDNFGLPFTRVGLNYIGFVPLIAYNETGLHRSEQSIKRFLDVVISGITLILFAPLFALIAFLIKLDSPGPIFYISPRCGKKGKVFNFYKFRSMVKDAHKFKEELQHKSEVRGPIFKIKSDPRVTRIGKFLRRYSLDELPQLINVLKGNMSLVGPRPPTLDEVAKYDFWQMRRLEIRPGITCLWQVRGRSDLSFYKWVKWDLWYVDNGSLGLDFRILLWTIPAVLKAKGAY